MSHYDAILEQIAEEHKRRRFAMKVQQTFDRRLESFIRINMTAWTPSLTPAARKVQNEIVKGLIKKIRAGEVEDNRDMVRLADESRAGADDMFERCEKHIQGAIKTLPIYPWVLSVKGFNVGGMGIILGEAGDLSRFHSVSALWHRLGYAPYDGQAGSTWKTGRPRKLTEQEWVDNPFKGERYAQCWVIADSMLKHQIISEKKTESGKAEPKGPYGKVYCDRRAHTDVTHPRAPEGVKDEWPDARRHKDAMRVMMKAFLKDLLLEWQRVLPYDIEKDVSLLVTETDASDAVKPKLRLRPSGEPGHSAGETQGTDAGLATNPKTDANARMRSSTSMRPSEPGQSTHETQISVAGLTPRKPRRKPPNPFSEAAE